MERKWTPAQTAAMTTLGRTLLISAAAGSGKTATLTERIIRRLTNPERPAELSRMLIVTFTRAAAAELKERIGQALAKAIEKDPTNRHLQKQYLGLGGAHISTIDSFCREPVKAHFAELGLPAATRIADEAELRPLRERIMGELIDEFYLRYADPAKQDSPYGLLHGNAFADLCDSLTPFKNDTELIPTLLSLYDRLLSFPEELSRLSTQATELESAAEGDFYACAHGGILREWISCFCKSALGTLDEALELITAEPAAAKAYYAAFIHDRDTCAALADAESYAEAYGILSRYENLRLGTLRGASPELVAAKDARSDLYKTLKKLRADYFCAPPEELAVEMKRTARMCGVLHALLSEYDLRILEEKKNRGICDFTDNRRYLLSLLRDAEGNPTPLACEYAERYDEVYIDEYQDVDEMQDEIFRLVGGDHRFMVGDIKQSIYVFRGADPSVFARYRRILPPLTQDEDGNWQGHSDGGNSLFMSENFRCDESVITVTNAICGHALRGCPDTVDYRAADDLGFSKLKPYEDYLPTPVQITELTKPPKGEEEKGEENEGDGELGGVEAEAAYVAGEIATLLREGKLANGSPILPKDIVILMRGRRALPAYRAALNNLRIPTEAPELETLEAGRDLLHGSDMSYLVNLLRVMDNPDGDVPLSEVLRAPFPGLTLDEVIILRNEGDPLAESHSLYAGIEEYLLREDADPTLKGKLSAFTQWLEYYRALTASQPIDGLLRLLCRDKCCASRETPAFRYLYEAARGYRSPLFKSLCSFLRYFETKLRTEKKAPVPADNSEEGHVTMMTIHNSKGLEFPVCFLVRCGQAFTHKSQSADLLFDKRAGVSLKLYSRELTSDGVRGGKTDTTLRRIAALSVKLTEREEEMRLLYVAMTRARERLYLVGTGNGKLTPFRAGDRYATLEHNSYLKLATAGLFAHPEAGPFYRYTALCTSDVPVVPPLPPRVRGSADPEQESRAAHYRAILANRPILDEADTLLRHLPTTVPASRMREDLLDACIFYETDIPEDNGRPPEGNGEGIRLDTDSPASVKAALTLMESVGEDEFELLLSAGRRPTASERGTAVHLFLQYCDHHRVTRHGLESEISRLAELGYLTPRVAEILDRPMLEGFFNSAFFARMQTATRVERELKFNRLIPLSELTRDPLLAKLVEGRTLLVRGSVDLLLTFADGHIELCDYKTDHITPSERKDPTLLAARMQESHRDQLLQYAAAMEAIYGVRPERAYVFSLPLGEAIEIPL